MPRYGFSFSEIAVAGVPAIFIPYPYAIDNHQSTNAQWLVKNKAALKIEQSELTVENLSSMLTILLTDNSQLNTMSAVLKKLAKPNATQKVVEVCEKACWGEERHAA